MNFKDKMDNIINTYYENDDDVNNDINDDDVNDDDVSISSNDTFTSNETNKTGYTQVSRIDDIDFDWIHEIEDYQVFHNDFPETLKVKSLLVNDNGDVIWFNEDKIITDNGLITQENLYKFIQHQINSLRKRLNTRKILVDDLQLFECKINEDNIHEYLNTNSPTIQHTHFSQKRVNFLKHNIQLNPSIGFFHLLNQLLIIFTLRTNNISYSDVRKNNTRKNSKHTRIYKNKNRNRTRRR